MGLGIVLLFWVVLSGILTAMAAAILVAVVYFIERRRGRIRKRWIIGAAVLPIVALAYVWAGFAAYAVWCEAVRDVDMGIGDSWRVPLVRDYKFTMIDTFEQGFIVGPGERQSHHDIKRIGMSGVIIAGQDASGFFVIDAGRGTDKVVNTEDDLRQEVSSAGVPPMELMTPEAFYVKHRFGVADVVGAIAIAGPPFVVFCAFIWRFARAGARGGGWRQSAAAPGGDSA